VTEGAAAIASGGHRAGDAIALAIYLGFLLYLVSRLFRRQSSGATDYLLAGRALTLPAFVATLVASWYGGILGVGEYGYRYGISNWLVFGVPYYVAALLFAFFVATRARQTAFVSIPDALRRTYGDGPARIAALVVFVMTAPASYVLMFGSLFGFAFGWSSGVGIVVGTVLSLAYVVRGGLRAVVRTDVLQVLLMFGGFALVVGYLLSTLGVAPLREGLPETHWTWHGGNSPQYVVVWFFIALATLIEPAFYQRVFAARSPRVARRGILVSVCCWVLFDALTTTTALYARALLPAGTDPVLAFPALGAEVLPGWVAAVFFVGMLATIMSTVDTYGFIASTTLVNLLAKDTDEMSDGASRRAQRGVLATGALSAGLALASDSVVSLWHGLGSVGTPALLLPVLSVFYPPLRVSRWVAAWILVPGLVAGAWLFGAREGAYWLGVEPIYAGLLLSAACRVTFGRGRGR
jgi:SSS family solute:Na+ symporter